MTAKLRALKTAALKWVDAKRALEAYANDSALTGEKIDQAKFAKLTLAYVTAERELEALATETTPVRQAVGWGQ